MSNTNTQATVTIDYDSATDLGKALANGRHLLFIDQEDENIVIARCTCRGFDRKVSNKKHSVEQMLGIIFREYAAHILTSVFRK